MRAAIRHTLIVAVAMLMTACGASKSATRTTLPTGPPPSSTTSAPPAPTTAATTTATTSTVTDDCAALCHDWAPPPATSTPAGPPTTTPSGPAVVITKGPSDRKVVALTFDAGSDTGRIAQILAILAAEHIHATFGITECGRKPTRLLSAPHRCRWPSDRQPQLGSPVLHRLLHQHPAAHRWPRSARSWAVPRLSFASSAEPASTGRPAPLRRP